MSASSARSLVIAVIIAFTVALGYRFVTDAETSMEGTLVVSEVSVLPDTAGDRVHAMAQACDEGDGDKCSALFSQYELHRDGLSGNSGPHLRRLCRKGCKLGATDLCEMWQNGDKRCPLGNN